MNNTLENQHELIELIIYIIGNHFYRLWHWKNMKDEMYVVKYIHMTNEKNFGVLFFTEKA